MTEYLNPNVYSRTVIEDAVARGTDGYVAPVDLEAVAEIHTTLAHPAEHRMFAMGLAVDLLTRGLMTREDAEGEPYFELPGRTLQEAIGKLLVAWAAKPLVGPGSPMPGEIAYLSNTPAGTELATAVLAREGWYPDPARPNKWIHRSGEAKP